MKGKKIYSAVWGLCLCAGLYTSCIKDDFSANGNGSGDSEYVTLNLTLDGKAAQTKATTEPGNGEWKENDVKSLDVFIFEAGGTTRTHYQRIVQDNPGVTAGDVTQGAVTLSLRKNQLGETASYDVYVIANRQDTEATTIANVQTADELAKLTLTRDFKYAHNVDHDEDPFLMDGKVINVTGAALADRDNPVKVTLRRAAAKILVTIEYGTATDGTAYRSGGTTRKRIMNYATTVPLLDDNGTLLSNGEQRGLTTMQAYINATGVESVFYSYPNTWSYDPESSEVDLQNESYILMDIPVQVYKPGESSYTELTTNYYYIPLNMGTADASQKLERNHFYNITVTVAAPGSSTETQPVELSGKVVVQDWQETTIDVGNDNAEYLEVNEQTLQINNSNEDNSIEFYSSSRITLATVKDVRYVDKFGVERNITSTQTYYPQGSTYYPKVTADSENTGLLHIESTELVNVVKKFTIVVTNADGLTKEIKVEQYPLEYVTSTQGWYSYREDYGGTIFNRGTTSGGIFYSKVVREYYSTGDNAGKSKIDPYYWYNNRLNYFATGGHDPGNARMYHVHITTTPKVGNVTYRLGYPKMTDGVTDSGTENSTIVSPSFMIASQLGTVQPTGNLTIAAENCKNYVEVTNAIFDSNGNVTNQNEVRTYNDWRLPTRAEIEIIKKYQNMSNSAIDVVLSGRYYWAADGAVDVGGTVDNYPGAIRCVRDVKPQN